MPNFAVLGPIFARRTWGQSLLHKITTYTCKILILSKFSRMLEKILKFFWLNIHSLCQRVFPSFQKIGAVSGFVVIAKIHHYIKSGLSQIFAIFWKLNLKCAGGKLDLGPRNLAWIVYMVGGVDDRKDRVCSKRLTHPKKKTSGEGRLIIS